ncbi:hypothetical protein SDC9_172826 [bioreactor metagenome]|uniref:Uncharacterized protein n=1 Tax=bioreactor metagenome TaxID=1076179 RepID=A0A645GES0_9ZZZZ
MIVDHARIYGWKTCCLHSAFQSGEPLVLGSRVEFVQQSKRDHLSITCPPVTGIA